MPASPWHRFLMLSIALLWLAAPVPTEPVQAQDDATLRHRFLNEAPQGWKQLRDVLLHSKGRLSLSVRVSNPTGGIVEGSGYDEDVSFMLNGSDHRRVVSNDRGSIGVGCRNSQYTFLLKAAKGGTDVYRVDAIIPVDPSSPFQLKQQGKDHIWRIEFLIYSPFAIQDDELTDILQSKTFQLQSVRAVGEPDQRIEVRFRYEPPAQDKRLWPAADKQVWDVIMTLDPVNLWAVQHYRLEVTFPTGTVIRDCTLHYDKDAFRGTLVRLPNMATVVIGGKEVFQSGGIHEKWELALKEFAMAEIPESEFTLSAFGLTEAGESIVLARRSSRWPLLLIGLGVILLIVGIWSLRRRSPLNTM